MRRAIGSGLSTNSTKNSTALPPRSGLLPRKIEQHYRLAYAISVHKVFENDDTLYLPKQAILEAHHNNLHQSFVEIYKQEL